MKVLNPDNTRVVAPEAALTIPLYRCHMCHDHVEVRGVTVQEASDWKSRELIQNVWPHMDADTRECIILRACRACYVKHYVDIWGGEDDHLEAAYEDAQNGGYEDWPIDRMSDGTPAI